MEQKFIQKRLEQKGKDLHLIPVNIALPNIPMKMGKIVGCFT